ncbi:hypothetical protein SAMN04488021_10260 [Paracoccus aminovorans]|uniref:Uncharacterized protein n=1 Tax=Paracoccus aminovorans TaxID=34004 RepID=A0A1I2XRN1_9RHOB|nr:hypothetical protein [Paracoccus aminovorans]CQR87278.1 hypothetical protein JCM7685_2734 [Paracoccus aminovorans]SFH16123.1 hypothetical protein SAMN04488021_10260 [Paracoccus aminovorans]
MTFHLPLPHPAAMPGDLSRLAAFIEAEIVLGMNDCMSVNEIATRISAKLCVLPDHSEVASARTPIAKRR